MPDYLSIARRALERRDKTMRPDPREEVLKGLAIELWSDKAGSLFIVADEDDTRRLDESKDAVHTAAGLQRVVQIGDPATVLEIHQWKRKFDALLDEYKERKP